MPDPANSATHGAGETDILWEVPDSYEEWMTFSEERSWGDGLPLVPPTVPRVANALSISGLHKDDVIGAIPPSWRQATVRDVAINAVMAGLPPENLVLVVSAIKAMLRPEFNLYAIQATTNPVAPLVIVNGPIRDENKINYSYGCLGPGAKANATIGRSIRLILMNIGGGRPGELDRATIGQPAKFTAVLAENEERAPWGPLASSRGAPQGSNSATIIGVCCLVNHLDNTSTTSKELLTSLCHTISHYGSNTLQGGGEMLVILSPEHAEILSRDIPSRSQLQEAIYEHSVVSRDIFTPQALKLLTRRRNAYPKAIEGRFIHVLDQPEDLLIVVAGGAGLHSMIGPSLGPTRAVTAFLD